jgi:hypothetical protein
MESRVVGRISCCPRIACEGLSATLHEWVRISRLVDVWVQDYWSDYVPAQTEVQGMLMPTENCTIFVKTGHLPIAQSREIPG